MIHAQFHSTRPCRSLSPSQCRVPSMRCCRRSARWVDLGFAAGASRLWQSPASHHCALISDGASSCSIYRDQAPRPDPHGVLFTARDTGAFPGAGSCGRRRPRWQLNRGRSNRRIDLVVCCLNLPCLATDHSRPSPPCRIYFVLPCALPGPWMASLPSSRPAFISRPCRVLRKSHSCAYPSIRPIHLSPPYVTSAASLLAAPSAKGALRRL